MGTRKLVRVALVLAVALAAVWAIPASAAVTVTKAIGGEALSADTAGGTYTSLTVAKINEATVGEIGLGSIVLALPAGFEYQATAVNVRALPVATSLRMSTSAACAVTGTDINVVPSGSNLTLWICAASSGAHHTRLEFTGMFVRPTSGTPLASGEITVAPSSTATINGLTKGVTSLGTLGMVAGAQAGVAISPQNPTVTVGAQQQFTGSPVDQWGNPTPGSVTWSALPAAGTISASGLFTAVTTPGTHANAVTASFAPHTASTGVTIVAGSLDSIVVSPATAEIAAGATQPYTVEGFDSHGNSLGDKTGEAAFAATGAATCTAASCGSETAGSYTVTASIGTVTDDAALTVVPAAYDHIELSPSTAEIAAGETQAYTVGAYDQYGNFIGDVTGDAEITASEGASCDGAVCTSTTAGTYTITADIGGATTLGPAAATTTDTATLTVVAAALDHIDITPATAEIVAGGSQAYAVSSYDAYGNLIADVTGDATIVSSDGATCDAGACGSATAGSYMITATYSGLTDTATLTVVAAELDYLTITPSASQIAAGESQSYVVNAYDQNGNLIGEVTGDATLSPSSGASCAAAECTSTVAGVYTITASYEGKTVDATLTVVAAALDHLTIDPSSSQIEAGESQAYVVNAYDAYDNLIGEVTGDAAFDGGDDISCENATCTSTVAAQHTITASYDGKTVDATLTVVPGPLHHLILDPAASTITAGDVQTYMADGYDQYDNFIENVTASTTFALPPQDGSCAGNICTSEIAGDYTVTGTLGDASGTASLTVEPAAAATLVAAIDPGEVVADGASVASLTAEVHDVYGNARLADTVTAATDGDAAVPATLTANATGYEGTVVASTTAGVETITVADGVLSVTVTLTEVAGDVAHVTITAGKTIVRSTIPGNIRTDGTTITVVATDAFGNAIIGAPVRLVIPDPRSGVPGAPMLDPVLTPGEGTTDGAGRFTASYTPGSLPGRDQILATVETGGTVVASTIDIDVVLCTAPCPTPEQEPAAAAAPAPAPAALPAPAGDARVARLRR